MTAQAPIDARSFLSGLIEETIWTVTGKLNVVLAVTPTDVVVGTSRSPAGTSVPLTEVQAALDRLTDGEEVPVSVNSLGYRSAFIGAVLSSVPGTKVISARPKRVVLKSVEVPKPRRNPDWTWDEEILAFHLYRRIGMADDTHPEVIELSAQLRSLPIHPASSRTPRFRNPNSVARKLADIGTRDPAHPERNKTSGSRLDEEVWKRYGSKSGGNEVATLAELIRQAETMLSDGEAAADDYEGVEGKIAYRLHLRRERDRTLVKKKKDTVRKATGSLACEVCGFDFEAAWGTAGKDFIEVHHLVPLANGEANTKLSDLAVLCANCHRMAHRIQPWPSIQDLRGALAADVASTRGA